MDFKPGDLVRLKSGGPVMTVEQVGKTILDDDGVWCVWSDKIGNKQVVQRDTFPPVVLEKAEKPRVEVLAVGRA